jgi:hypothetical protein
MDIKPTPNGFMFMGMFFTYDLEGNHPYEKLIKNSIETNLGVFEFQLHMSVNGIRYYTYDEFYRSIFKTW